MIVTHEQTRTDEEIIAYFAGLTKGLQIFSGLLHERFDEPPRLPDEEDEDEDEDEGEGEEDEGEEDEPDEGDDDEDS